MLRRFLEWWLRELRESLPGALRRWVDRRAPRLYLRATAEGLVLEESTDGAVTRLQDLPERRRARLVKSAARGRLQPVLKVDRDRLMHRDISLPATAERQLTEVLGFEIATMTPFEPPDLFWSWHLKRRNPAEKTLLVEVVLLPIATVADPIEMALEAGLDLRCVAAADQPDRLLHLHAALPGRKHGGFGAMVFKAGVVVCLVSAMTWLVMTHQKLTTVAEAAESALAQVRRAAAEIPAAAAMNGNSPAARRAYETYMARPTALKVLATLTEALPDGTVISSFELSGRNVEIGGLAGDAAELVSLLDATPEYGTPEFLAPVRRDPEAGKDRFTLAFEIATDDDND